jgi:hypothetical protein
MTLHQNTIRLMAAGSARRGFSLGELLRDPARPCLLPDLCRTQRESAVCFEAPVAGYAFFRPDHDQLEDPPRRYPSYNRQSAPTECAFPPRGTTSRREISHFATHPISRCTIGWVAKGYLPRACFGSGLVSTYRMGSNSGSPKTKNLFLRRLGTNRKTDICQHQNVTGQLGDRMSHGRMSVSQCPWNALVPPERHSSPCRQPIAQVPDFGFSLERHFW